MQNITPQELKKLMAEEKIKIVDVRKNHEVAQGIIEGAIHIPMPQVNEWLTSQNEDLHWFFYCHIGVRSGQVGLIADSLDFKNVYNLSGGIVAWHQSGYSLAQK